MLEGLIVVVFLTIVLFALVFAGGLYRAKLEAMQEARFTNMDNATNGCEPRGHSYSASNPDDSLEWPKPVLHGESLALVGVVVREVQEIGGVSRAQSSRGFGFGTWAEQTVTGYSRTACNPKPREWLNGIGVVQLVWQGISGATGSFFSWIQSLF